MASENQKNKAAQFRAMHNGPSILVLLFDLFSSEKKLITTYDVENT